MFASSLQTSNLFSGCLEVKVTVVLAFNVMHSLKSKSNVDTFRVRKFLDSSGKSEST